MSMVAKPRQLNLDELRRLIGSEYFDILLMHNQHFASWPVDSRVWQDGLIEARAGAGATMGRARGRSAGHGRVEAQCQTFSTRQLVSSTK